MSVLVTGGAGFIGSHIVDRLLKEGFFVRVFDNLQTGLMDNLKHHQDNDRFEFMYGDIARFSDIRAAVKGMTLICHQAALGSVPRSIANPLASHETNVTGFVNLLWAAKEEGIKRIVYASSSAVYGDDEKLPKIESSIGNPLSPYAVTKNAMELYAKTFHATYGLECIGLRYFNVFGERQRADSVYAAVIPKFISQLEHDQAPVINGDGTTSRDFTHVDNVVQANLLALTTQNANCFGKTFNIARGGRESLNKIYNVIASIMGKQHIVPTHTANRQGDIAHSNADITRAKRMLGYYPRVSFDEGIHRTVNAYLSRVVNSPSISH